MPSTGWNVFVTSVVLLVVYFAFQAGDILLGLIAGTLVFVVGWLLGYARSNQILDSMGIGRMFVSGAVTVFAIVWAILVSKEYLLGLIVICLVWFAAWFTSEMGPIKGTSGAMATEVVDEPKPPENHDEHFQTGTVSEGETDPDDEPSGKSIFGLGIFYDDDTETTAGATDTDGGDDEPADRGAPDLGIPDAESEEATTDADSDTLGDDGGLPEETRVDTDPDDGDEDTGGFIFG